MAEDYKGYSGEMRRFQKAEPPVRPTPPKLSTGSASHRRFLDGVYNLKEDPHGSWKLKRQSLRRDSLAIDPTLNSDELEQIYEMYDLGQDTNPGDWSRERSFTGTLSRAGSLIANQAGAMYDLSGFLFDRARGDTEGMMENAEELEEIAFENSMIHQYQSKDMNAVTQFLFDLTVSAPTMLAVMGGGLLAAKATAGLAAAAGVTGVAAWIAGTLGFNAVESLVESGFNYIDIISDPMVRGKIETALGRKMTDADQEEIRAETLRILSDRADDSAKLVAYGNFLNPLNFTHTYGAGRLSKLIKVASGRWGTAGRMGLKVAGREALEEALQSAGSQYTASEAKMRAIEDAGGEISFPLRPGTIYGVDPKQVGYEALMGAVVGKGLGFAQGAVQHKSWTEGKFDLDKYGNPVRDGDPVRLDENGERIFTPNSPQFLGKGRILSEVRRIINLESEQDALNQLGDFRKQAIEGGDLRKQKIIDDELANMEAGAELFGERSSIEVKEMRQKRAKAFNPEVHWTRPKSATDEDADTTETTEETEAVEVAEEAEAPVTTTDVGFVNINNNDDVKAWVSELYEKPSRTVEDEHHIRLANKYPNLKRNQIKNLVKDLGKGGEAKAETKQAEPAAVNLNVTPATPSVIELGATPEKAPAEVIEDVPYEVVQEGTAKPVVTEVKDTKTNEQKIAEAEAAEDLEDAKLAAQKAAGVETEQVVQDKADVEGTPDVLTVGDTASEAIELVKGWAGQSKDAKNIDGIWVKPKDGTEVANETWGNIRGDMMTPIATMAVEANVPSYTYTTKKKKKSKVDYNIPVDVRKAVAIDLANRLGIPVPEAFELPVRPPKKTTAKADTTEEKADTTEEAGTEEVADTTEGVAEEEVAATTGAAIPEPRMKANNVILYDANGKKIYDKKDKNLKYKHDSELIQTLIGKEVLHYQTNKGYKIDNPYSFPKRLKQWRFDGVDANGNVLFSQPAKGKEARSKTVKDAKDLRNYLLNKKGHPADAERMFLHLVSGLPDSYSVKAGKTKPGQYKHGFLTMGMLANTPLKVLAAEGTLTKERGPKTVFSPKEIEDIIHAQAILQATEGRTKSADFKSPEQVFAETEGDVGARTTKAQTIAEANKEKQEGDAEVVDDTKKSKEQQMKEKLAARREAEAADKKAKADKKTTTKTQTPVTPPKDQDASGTITEAELRSNHEKNFLLPAKYRKEWANKLLENERYTDLTKWDGTGKGTAYLAEEIKNDLGGEQAGVNRAYPKLMSKIRDRLTNWLVANVNKDNIKELSKRYFPLIRTADRTLVNEAAARKGAGTADTKVDKYSPSEKEAKQKLAEGKKGTQPEATKGMPKLTIDRSGPYTLINFSKPQRIKLGKGDIEGLQIDGNEVFIRVKGKTRGERILFTMRTHSFTKPPKNTMLFSLAHSSHPKGVYADVIYKRYGGGQHSKLNPIIWKDMFGGIAVNEIMDVAQHADLTTREGQMDAVDKAIDILVPGTRGILEIADALQADTGITLGAGKPIVRQITPASRQSKPWKKEVLDEAQARVDEVLKKKPLVSEPVEVVGEPTIIKDAVKASKKIPFKDASVPDTWQILTSEVERIFSPFLTKVDNKKLTTFIESLGADDGFIVSAGLNKGDPWKIFRFDSDLDVNKNPASQLNLTTLNPKAQDVPSYIKNVLQKHGRVIGKDREKNQYKSRKLDKKDLLEDSPLGAPPSDLLARVDRDVDVNLKELDDAVSHVLNQKVTDDSPRMWAFAVGNEVEVAVYKWKDGKMLDPDVTFVEFKDGNAANEFAKSINNKNPDRAKMQGVDEEILDNLISLNQTQSFFGEEKTNATALAMQGLQYRYGVDLNEGISDVKDESGYVVDNPFYDPRKAAEDAVVVKEYTKEEREAYEATLRDKGTHYSLKEDTVTISPEAKKPTVEDLYSVVDKFQEQFGNVVGSIELITNPTNPFFLDKRGIKGAYSAKNDTIYLVAGNLASKEDAAMTLFHEAIGHRSYKNPETQVLNNEERAELENLVKDSFPEEYNTEYSKQLSDIQSGKKEALEGMTDAETAHSLTSQELLAHKVEKMAEKDFNATFFEQLSAWVRKVIRNFFNRMGLGDFKINDTEIKVLFNKLAHDLDRTNKADLKPYEGVDSELPADAMYRRGEMDGMSTDAVSAYDRIFPIPASEGRTSLGKWWSGFWKRTVHSVADPFAVIKREVGKVPYMVTRLANREDGVMHNYMYNGPVEVFTEVNDGIKVNMTRPSKGGKALADIFKTFGAGKKGMEEVERFVGWYAMKRADILEKKIGEETLGILRKDIDAILDPNTGSIVGNIRNAKTGVTTTREAVYTQASKDLAEWNKSVVQFGIDMGLFDKESASNWNTEWYLPFFRHFEEEVGADQPKGTRNYKALAGQTGIKKLKGSQKPLDHPLNNLLRNALHIVTASLKNDAAALTLKQAEGIKTETGLPLAQRTKYPSGSSLKVIQDGKDINYDVNNQLLYESLGSLNKNNDFAGLGWAIKAKGLFTRIITLSPIFKYNNVTRDTWSAAAQSDVGFNVLKNAVGGFRSLSHVKPEMQVSGAYLQFGWLRSDDPKYAEKTLTKGMKSGFLGADPSRHKGFNNAIKKYWTATKNVFHKYEDVGDKLENANRAAIFTHHKSKGDTVLKAAFEARDIMDFTLHGGARWVNLVTSITPFANALIQGKYKFGRSMKDNPKPMIIVGSAVTLAAMAEYFMWGDDEEYNRRQDWDRDQYWWIKIPGTETVFRMAKPHELSIMANLAWRGLDIARKEDVHHGELFASAVKSVLTREFNMGGPFPHIINPMVEVMANESFFFDRPIEPYRFKNLTPKEKRDVYTSETMIKMSEAFDWAGVELSPMQLQHLVNGYFSWIGEGVIATADLLISKSFDFPEKPAAGIMDNFLLRKAFKTSPLRNTKASTAFYERLKDIEQAHADLTLSQKLGDWGRYKEIYEEQKDQLRFRKFMKKKQRMLNELNKRIKQVRFSTSMGPEEKRIRMDKIYAIRNQLLDRIAESPALR